MVTGWAGFHLSHPATSTRRQASILEPEVPAGGIEFFRYQDERI